MCVRYLHFWLRFFKSQIINLASVTRSLLSVLRSPCFVYYHLQYHLNLPWSSSYLGHVPSPNLRSFFCESGDHCIVCIICCLFPSSSFNFPRGSERIRRVRGAADWPNIRKGVGWEEVQDLWKHVTDSAYRTPVLEATSLQWTSDMNEVR